MLVVFLLSQEVCDQIERESSTQVAKRNSNESNKLENCMRSTFIPNLNVLTTLFFYKLLKRKNLIN